jgi:hypothetical protein
MTMRLRDWQSRLAGLVLERFHVPFKWGENDCCLFAADCVNIITGHDPASDMRGYTDQRGAVRILSEMGGVEGVASARAGEEIAPALSQPGDIGLIHCEDRPTLAVCMGGHWIAPGELGLVTFLPDQVVRAWRCC